VTTSTNGFTNDEKRSNKLSKALLYRCNSSGGLEKHRQVISWWVLAGGRQVFEIRKAPSRARRGLEMTVPGGEGDRIRATVAVLGGQGDGEESGQDHVDHEKHCKIKEQIPYRVLSALL
jgi:hypothetical protein